MEHKKNIKADLENKRVVFFEFGLVVVLAILLLAFEWGTKLSEGDFLDIGKEVIIEEEMIVTRQEEPPPPPPPPQVIQEFLVFEDEVDIDESDIDIDIEADQNLELDLIVFDEEEAAEEEVFIIVEDMPSFMGKQGDEGLRAFRAYIQKLVDYPEIARENGISGTVLVQFTVNKTGNVVNVVVLRGVDPVLDDAAIKGIKKSPKWTPGRQRNLPVNVRFSCPITFTLQQ